MPTTAVFTRDELANLNPVPLIKAEEKQADFADTIDEVRKSNIWIEKQRELLQSHDEPKNV